MKPGDLVQITEKDQWLEKLENDAGQIIGIDPSITQFLVEFDNGREVAFRPS